MKKVIAIILMISGALAIVGTIVMQLLEKNAVSASLGVIGGADGPTAIIVSGSIGNPVIVAIVGVLLIVTAIFLLKKKK